MFDPHDLFLIRLGCHFQTIGYRSWFQNQRMIPSRFKWILAIFEEFFVVMMNHRRLAMHQSVCSDHLCPKHRPNTLMPQTNP